MFYFRKISSRGLVEIQFSEQFVVVSNLTWLNLTALNLQLLSAEDRADTLEPSFTWNVTTFETSRMEIQLNFQNPITISAYEPRD